MMLRFLGVRGSTPAPGRNFAEFGGHTSCVAVAADGADEPSLILDAGTGIRCLPTRSSQGFHGSILLSHLHWDHVAGLPFFRAGDRADASVDLYVPEQMGLSARDLLARMMSPPLFPISPEGLLGAWHFLPIAEGTQKIGAFAVTAAEVAHKGGRTFGYRIEHAGGSLAYLPDHAPAQGVSDAAWELMEDVDVLMHDAQFLDSERGTAEDYAHCTVTDAIAVAARARARRLVLFHHSPMRTDAELSLLERGTAVRTAPFPVVVAREGMNITI